MTRVVTDLGWIDLVLGGSWVPLLQLSSAQEDSGRFQMLRLRVIRKIRTSTLHFSTISLFPHPQIDLTTNDFRRRCYAIFKHEVFYAGEDSEVVPSSDCSWHLRIKTHTKQTMMMQISVMARTKTMETRGHLTALFCSPTRSSWCPPSELVTGFVHPLCDFGGYPSAAVPFSEPGGFPTFASAENFSRWSNDEIHC